MKASQGISFLKFQLVLLAVGLAVAGMYWLILGRTSLAPLLFALIAGNCISIWLRVTAQVYERQTFPWDWLVFLAILIPGSVIGSYLASLAWRLVSGRGAGSLLRIDWDDIQMGTFVSLITGVSIYVSAKGRIRLRASNRELENRVTLGQIQLQTQEEDLNAAHEIQAHLLPREIPQVTGLQVSCAWQPARSVSGDYFDVLALAPGQIAVCLADVSGKGIAAALLMANLQAAVRAFSRASPDPAMSTWDLVLSEDFGRRMDRA